MDVRLRQGGRRVNLALGLLLVAGVLTGLGANTIGVNWPLDLIQLHAAGGAGHPAPRAVEVRGDPPRPAPPAPAAGR